MQVEDLDYGGYYTVRGHEYIVLVFWHNEDGWWFEQTDDNGVYANIKPRGEILVEYDPISDNERGSVSWTLDDVIPDSPEAKAIADESAHIDEVARDILADVDI